MDGAEGEESGWFPSIMLYSAVIFVVLYFVRYLIKGDMISLITDNLSDASSKVASSRNEFQPRGSSQW